ncbi:hypothetical protein TNCV_187321 [Trichonephila clavipes]|nr:hypothetical protein TNCV_187321 [Trichonephila clavipes]
MGVLLSCSNLDADEDIIDYEESEESADIIDNIPVNPEKSPMQMISLRVHSSPFDLDNSTPSSGELADSYLRCVIADSKPPRYEVHLNSRTKEKKSFKAHQPLKTMFENKSPAVIIFSHSQLDSDNASIVNTSVASLSTPNYLLVPNTDEENRLLIKQTIFSKEERVLYYASRKRSTFG